MKILKQTYEAIKNHLKDNVPEVRTINLWNNQINYEQEQIAIVTPAVYVEMPSAVWGRIGKSSAQHGTGVVRIYVVQNKLSDSYTIDGSDAETQGDALDRFDLVQIIHNKLQQFRTPYFKELERSGTDADVDHNNIIVDIIDYSTTLIDNNVNELQHKDGNFNRETTLKGIIVEPKNVPDQNPNGNEFTIPQ